MASAPISSPGISVAGNFFFELLSIAFEPDAERVLGWLSAVREEQRKIVCDGLIDPLIPVAGPTDDVAPPLVGDLMIRDDIRKRLLPCGRESGAVLRFRGQERKRGEIEQARPALAESARNLRDTQRAEGERAAECFVKMNGRIDVPGKCF